MLQRDVGRISTLSPFVVALIVGVSGMGLIGTLASIAPTLGVLRILRRRVSPGREGRIGLLAILVLAIAIPSPMLAQTGVVVEGRVLEAGTTAGIQNAIVELVGHGATLTSAAGTFRFEGVDPRGYVFRVDAFGYASESRFLAVDGYTTVSVPLEIAPLPLDSLVVEPRAIDIKGRVRDPGRGLLLVDAEILTNQIPPTGTDDHGRFTLDDVFEDVPLRVIVRAFGYVPVDTILLPDEDESYLFELVPDTVVERMIGVQVRRLEERAAGRRSALMRPMNRERLLRYAGHADLLTTLEFEYWRRIGRVGCVVLDEEQLLGGATSLLWTMLPEELERIEFLFRGAMLRIYTREFMREMIAGGIELRRPSMVGTICR